MRRSRNSYYYGYDDRPTSWEIVALLVIILLNVWVLRSNYPQWSQRLALVAAVVIAFLEVLSYLGINPVGKDASTASLLRFFTGLAFVVLVALSIGALATYLRPVDVGDRVQFADGSRVVSMKTGQSIGVRADGLEERPRRLDITLAIVNQDDALGECANYTELVTDSNRVRLAKYEADGENGYAISSSLGDGQADLEFDLTVTNVEEENNCVVDISIERARLER
ncbi:hypothetical protein [Kineosporia babensis]|uniref:Uncharacterized protein n=1 Tax=Kineosporia babensis TaxID=499548 RepID=A0A9X1SY69_9ACTN|nr:hypothetical protein [Kineosporia babensis]MCD5316962.1 hypothetical protein [Kineosporia babensis]